MSVIPISVSPCEPYSVESMSYVIMAFLTPLAPTIISDPLLWGSLALAVGLYICSHQLLEDAAVMTIRLVTDLWI